MNFKKIFAILALTASWIGVATAQSTTYRLNSAGNYSSVTNYTNCPAGQTCANYTTSMTQTGSFTLSSPVGANLVNATITPTAYSFSDGINTYSNTDAGSRINHFKLTTNGSETSHPPTSFFQNGYRLPMAESMTGFHILARLLVFLRTTNDALPCQHLVG
jgi:hypothetical protein